MELNDEYNMSVESDSCSDDSAINITFQSEELGDDDVVTNLSEEVENIYNSFTNMLSSGHIPNINEEVVVDLMSDELRSSSADSEEETSKSKKPRQPIFSLLKDMKEMKWQPGILFRCKEEFKDAVTTYAVHMGVGLKLTKNDKSRVRFKCKEGCDWEIYATPVKNQDTWEMRTIKDKHTCSREFNNRLLSAKWLGKRIESRVRENSNIQLKQIVSKTKEKWVVGISKDKAYRAKKHANTLLEGCVGEQYNMLNFYCAEILRSNQDSSVFMKFTWPPEFFNESSTPSRATVPRFQRLYICFKGCRESFNVCRPIIGLDGCFLKGQYGGQLLTAIGRDPNEQMLPIAYAVVEVENKDS